MLGREVLLQEWLQHAVPGTKAELTLGHSTSTHMRERGTPTQILKPTGQLLNLDGLGKGQQSRQSVIPKRAQIYIKK